MNLFKLFTHLFKFDYNWYNTFFYLRVFPETNVLKVDDKYYELTKNIRNYNVLTEHEIEYIHTLSIPQLLEIILIYDLHTQIIKPLILED